jgi:hypothetical protein
MPVEGPLDEETLSVICTRAHELVGDVSAMLEGKAGPDMTWYLPDGKVTLIIGDAFPDGTPQPYHILHWLLVAGGRACSEVLGTYDRMQLSQVHRRLDWTQRRAWATACGYVDLNGRLTERGRRFEANQELARRAARAVDEISLDNLRDLEEPPGGPES